MSRLRSLQFLQAFADRAFPVSHSFLDASGPFVCDCNWGEHYLAKRTFVYDQIGKGKVIEVSFEPFGAASCPASSRWVASRIVETPQPRCGLPGMCIMEFGMARPRMSKILSRPALKRRVASLQRGGKRVVFTNGCFDLIHPGHIRYLRAAKRLGDVLVVALNSDASVRRLKGSGRPLVRERDRCEVIAALEMVDYVTVFGADTPYALIKDLQPDVLVKGGDWRPDRIVGADVVRARGGIVRSLPYARGYSTSALVKKSKVES
jgi:rfaE bifunctional protein nucleotidyltransferase chain/domain